jgi:two-component system secretion response regulator SsrB
MIRVAIIDDHPLVIKAIENELDVEEDITIVGKADHGSKLLDLVHDTSPDVVILDLGMSEQQFEPVSTVQKLRLRYPKVQVLVLTGNDDKVWMKQLIDQGVLGYVLKSDCLSLHLAESIRTVHQGRTFYSPAVADRLAVDSRELNDKELVILRLVAEGFSNTAIAQELGSTEQTVSNRLTGIYKKLGVVGEATNSRVAAVNKARELRLLAS